MQARVYWYSYEYCVRRRRRHEAERGYDVAALKRRARPRIGSGIAQVSAIRLDPE